MNRWRKNSLPAPSFYFGMIGMGEKKKSYYRRMREKMIQALKTFTFMRSNHGRYTSEDYIHDYPDEYDDDNIF